MTDPFFQLVWRPWNILLVFCVWGGMKVMIQMFPKWFAEKTVGHWLLPVLPIWICMFFSTTVPGPWMPEGVPLAQKAMLGFGLGLLAGNFKHVANRLGLDGLLEKKNDV
jgi:hypothetical protein